MNKNKLFLSIFTLVCVVSILASISYAYFSAKVIVENKTETKLKSNTLGLEYTGVTDINITDIVPGDYMTKTFAVKNTSNRAVDYNIYMENITNEFNIDLVYTLKDGDTEVVSETPLPETSDKSYLKTSVSIDEDETKTYTLTIKFLYKADEAQNDMQGKEFRATLGVDTEDAEGTYSISGVIEDENGPVSGGTVVAYSEKQIINISNDGSIKIKNLEMGTHELYYMGSIDATSLTKEEIQAQAICSKTVSTKIKQDIDFECNDSIQLQVKNVDIKKAKPVTFAEDDWEIIKDALEKGSYPYQVGDTKEIDMGSLGVHTLRIANTSPCTNGETSQTTCGFVLEFADLITSHGMTGYSNSGGWSGSSMRSYVNSTIYDSLPDGLKDMIIDTTVISGHGDRGGNYTTIDKLYLLSVREVFNVTNSDTASSTTRQLDYYKNKGVTSSNYDAAIKTLNGTASIWWLRAPGSAADSLGFLAVAQSGGITSLSASSSRGVSPAFRIGISE